MDEAEQHESRGGGRPPGRRGAKPCRECHEYHWHVYEKKPRSGVWYVRVWHQSGKVREKVGAHGLALKVAEKRRTEIRECRFFPRAAEPEMAWDPPFADQLDDYLRRHGSTLVNHDGAERYVRVWKAAPETHGKTMRQIARVDAERYRERRRRAGAAGAKRRRGGAKPSTINKELRFACAVYYDFLDQLDEVKDEHKRGPVPPNPFASRRRRRQKLYYPEPAIRSRHLGSQGDDEVARLFDALPDLDARRKVCAAALSGVDRGPMFAWEWDRDIDFVARQVRSWRRKGDGTERVYWVPMVDDLERVLRDTRDEQAARWGKPSRWVWPDAKDSGPADGREFDRTVFQPALIAAEINKVIETRETKQVRAGKGVRTVGTVRRQIESTFRWKDLRHTFASWLRRAGAELGVIGAMLGHRPGSPMTERYAHLTADMKHEAVQRLSGIIPPCVEMATGPRTGPTDTRPRVH